MALYVVLDTKVIFEGLTKQAGACGLLIDAWQAGLITVCVSNTLYILYSLAHQVETGYRIERVSDAEVQKQAENIAALRSRWRELASDKTVGELLAARESAEPEPELTPELAGKITARIAAARRAQTLVQ